MNRLQNKTDIAEHKPKANMNNYVYVSSLSMLVLAIGKHLLYSKFKKAERKLIDAPQPPVNVYNAKTNTEPKRDIFEML